MKGSEREITKLFPFVKLAESMKDNHILFYDQDH